MGIFSRNLAPQNILSFDSNKLPDKIKEPFISDLFKNVGQLLGTETDRYYLIRASSSLPHLPATAEMQTFHMLLNIAQMKGFTQIQIIKENE